MPSVALASEDLAAQCHQLSNGIKRLACYDEQTSYGVALPAPEVSKEITAALPAPDGKQWRLWDEKSALDGRKDVWLSVASENTEGNSIGSPTNATLTLRCMKDRTNVLIGFRRYTTDNQNVMYRLDDEGVGKHWMEVMRGGDGIGIWSGTRAIPFIRKMLEKERLVVGYETYTGPVEFTFDISGIENRIQPLAKACGWKP